MNSDLWDKAGKKTRATILADFKQKAGIAALDGLGPKGGYPISQAEALINIEKFVDAVLRSKQPAYTFKGAVRPEVLITGIGKHLRDVIPLAGMFDDEHDYSEKPTLFLRACWLIERLFNHKLTRMFRRNARANLQYAEAMNWIVDLIRSEAKNDWFRRCIHDRHYETACKGKSLAEYTADVLKYCSKTLIVRLDLGYSGGSSSSVTIKRVFQDKEDLISLMESHKLFEHLTGYGWSVEQGEDKGFHIHMVFFLNGSEVRQDITIGDLIGEKLWREGVTLGRGTFYNCNKHKNKYERLGIGMIHRNSSEECANAIHCTQYLSKSGPFQERDDQYLRIRPARGRVFGTGQAPDVTARRRGRPAPDAPWLGVVYS